MLVFSLVEQHRDGLVDQIRALDNSAGTATAVTVSALLPPTTTTTTTTTNDNVDGTKGVCDLLRAQARRRAAVLAIRSARSVSPTGTRVSTRVRCVATTRPATPTPGSSPPSRRGRSSVRVFSIVHRDRTTTSGRATLKSVVIFTFVYESLRGCSLCCIVAIGVVVHCSRRCGGAIAAIVVVIVVASRIRLAGGGGQLFQIQLKVRHKLGQLQLGQSLNHILREEKCS
jgi:hypothetical protein